MARSKVRKSELRYSKFLLFFIWTQSLLYSTHKLFENILSRFNTFIGETCSGKSSLVNLILGEEILPYSVLSTTSTICELKYGEERRLVAHFKDKDPETGQPTKTILFEEPTGSSEQSYCEQISQYVLCDREKGSDFKKVEVFWPHILLQVVRLYSYRILGSQYVFRTFI